MFILIYIEQKTTNSPRLAAVRQRRIEFLLRSVGACSVEFLATELRVSEMTIRRDLKVLSDLGRAVRTHGGASIAERVVFEFQFLERVQLQQQQKTEIGLTAASLIHDGQSILLDSGTTTLSLARGLIDRRNLTVITTSLPIAAVLQRANGVQTLLLGGFVRHDSPDLAGAMTESNLESLRADLAMVGADGIDLDGNVYNASIAVGQMLSKMVTRAAGVYVLADSSKIGRTQLRQFGNAAGWKGLITDRGIDPVHLQSLRAAGVNVIIADAASEDAEDAR